MGCFLGSLFGSSGILCNLREGYVDIAPLSLAWLRTFERRYIEQWRWEASVAIFLTGSVQ